MTRRLALALALALACAHSPAPPPGPRPLTGRAEFQRGEASASLDLRYQLTGVSGRELEISAELRGGGTGSVGAVQLELVPTGLVLDGEPAFTAEVAAGQVVTHTWRLRAQADGAARVEVRHGLAGGPLDAALAGFRVTPDAIRLCGTSDCKDTE